MIVQVAVHFGFHLMFEVPELILVVFVCVIKEAYTIAWS